MKLTEVKVFGVQGLRLALGCTETVSLRVQGPK